MIVSLLPEISAKGASNTTSFTYEGYSVNYTVYDSWNNGQTVEVTLTNTGKTPIVNWALKYDAKGIINSPWNIRILENSDTEYIIKNIEWNYEIAPNETIHFGYTLTGDSLEIPSKFELCSKEMVVDKGYNIDMNITDSWETGFKGELIIKNTSDIALEAWKLSFDTNFEINTFWNCKTILKTKNHYTIESDVSSNPIPAGDSLTIGFEGAKSIAGNDKIDNYVLTTVIINQDIYPTITDNIELQTSLNEVCVEPGFKTIYFYAYSKMDVNSLELIDSESNQIVATLVDDGDYSNSGDDIKGDGVYTCKLAIDVSDENVYSYTAKYSDGLQEIVSNTAEIYIYNELTDQELENMEKVNTTLSEWKSSDEFTNLSVEEKIKKTNDLLISLSTDETETEQYSLIIKDSIYFDESSSTFSFSYNCGALGVISLEDPNSQKMEAQKRI
ncbi:MAG: cellulose binding domain-containing protein [Clostridiales bacterium]|nr:cellulose binding domain-containing protein [Clostridiales bacterium]